jgi:uncharacterized membrane protein YfhO
VKEPVTVTINGPRRVELDASLAKPGLVILADIFYPGWKLTIDDKPAPIYRANRMMRAAAVEAGDHHLVYTYEPRSFYAGSIVSIAALAGLLGLCVYFSRRPVSTLLASSALTLPCASASEAAAAVQLLLGAISVVE